MKKYLVNALITLIVFLAIFIIGTKYAFASHVWGTSVEGAVYFLAAVIGAGLFWIGINLKK